MRLIEVVFVLAAFATVLATGGCTEQEQAKTFGGDYEYPLGDCEKVVNVTWKDNVDLWVLTRPFQAGDEPTTYSFQQDKGSVVQLFNNGRVTLREHCQRE